MPFQIRHGTPVFLNGMLLAMLLIFVKNNIFSFPYVFFALKNISVILFSFKIKIMVNMIVTVANNAAKGLSIIAISNMMLINTTGIMMKFFRSSIINPCSEYIPLVDLVIKPVILNLLISSSGRFIRI